MIAAHPALSGKFTDLAFDEPPEIRSQESRPTEAGKQGEWNKDATTESWPDRITSQNCIKSINSMD